MYKLKKKKLAYSFVDNSASEKLIDDYKERIETDQKGWKKELILKIAEQLEIENNPKSKIASIITKKLDGYESKAWIYRVLPDNYKDQKTETDEFEKFVDANKRKSLALRRIEEGAVLAGELCDLGHKMVNQLLEVEKTEEGYKLANEEMYEDFINKKDIEQHAEEMSKGFDGLKENIDKMRHEIDRRHWVDLYLEAVIKLMAIFTPFRFIAKIFNTSTKWISKLVKEDMNKRIDKINISRKKLELTHIDAVPCPCENCPEDKRDNLLKYVSNDAIKELTNAEYPYIKDE